MICIRIISMRWCRLVVAWPVFPLKIGPMGKLQGDKQIGGLQQAGDSCKIVVAILLFSNDDDDIHVRIVNAYIVRCIIFGIPALLLIKAYIVIWWNIFWQDNEDKREIKGRGVSVSWVRKERN